MRQLSFTNLVSRTSTLPVSLRDLKDNLSIAGYDDDKRITDLAWEAIDHIENTYNLAIVSQQWTQSCPSLYPNSWSYNWSGGYPYYHTGRHDRNLIALQHYPVASLDSVHYYDINNTLQSFDVSNFVFLKDGRYQSFVALIPSAALPSTFDRPDCWQFTYHAGFTSTLNTDGSVSTTCPQGILRYIKAAVSTMNETREGEIVGTIVSKPHFDLDVLIAPYVLMGVAS